MNGAAPIEVTSVVDETPGIEVDQHSITVAATRAGCRSSRRAGAPSPIPGRSSRSRNAASCWSAPTGTISSYDYDDHVTLQTRGGRRRRGCRSTRCRRAGAAPIEYMLARIADGAPIDGPLDPGALPRRAADRGQRRAVGRRRSARVALVRMSEDAGPRRLRLKSAAAAEVARAGARLPAADAARTIGRGSRWSARAAFRRRISTPTATAGFDVAVICSRTLAQAEARRDEFFPEAEATDDIAAHADPRRHRGRRPDAASRPSGCR